MRLLIHSQTSTVQSLTFGNAYVSSPHTPLGMWLLIHVVIIVNSLRPSDAYMPQQTSHHSSDDDLYPGRRQAIIWTIAGILLNWPLGTNFIEISIEIQTFSIKKIHFKMSSGKWRPYCLSLNVLIYVSEMGPRLLLHIMIPIWWGFVANEQP